MKPLLWELFFQAHTASQAITGGGPRGESADSLHALSEHLAWQPVVGTMILMLIGVLTWFIVRDREIVDKRFDGSKQGQQELRREQIALERRLGQFETHVAAEYVSRKTLFELVTGPNNQSHASIENSIRDLRRDFNDLGSRIIAHLEMNGHVNHRKKE